MDPLQATSGTFPIVVTGTWGSKDGVTKWKLPDDLYKITKINIAVGEYGINSIRFTYKDNYGGTQTTDKYGGDGGKDYTVSSSFQNPYLLNYTLYQFNHITFIYHGWMYLGN